MDVSAVLPVIWTGEWKLVRAILTADWSAQAKHAWDPALFRDIDWTKIPNLAWRCKLRPMMAAALREAGWPGVPADIRTAVEAAEQQCVRKAVWQLKLLATIGAAAERQNIRVIALKGVALSLRLYGDPFIREAFDLDLLVHPGDHVRFQEIVRAQDCAPHAPGPALSPRQMAILQRFHHDTKFIHTPSGVVVECHNALDRNPHLIRTDFEALWRARDKVSLPGAPVAILGEDDLVYSLGIHASRHNWERWKWIADLAVLFRTVDAARLSHWRLRAAQEGNEALFDSWLLLLASTTELDLPEQSLGTAARNRQAMALTKRALRFSARELTPAEIRRQSYLFAGIAGHMLLKRSLRFLAFELAAIWHHDKEWYTLRLPDSFIWLYYVLRPFTYLGRHSKGLLAAIRSKKVENAEISWPDRF